MNLLELPECVLEEIFQYLSYDDIAKKRLVSTKINRICQSLLNRAVSKLKNRIANKIKKLKPLVPRKESERWTHTAAKKIRYLEKIDYAVRVLANKYDEYIRENLCCFIPGKVIDISLNILKSERYPTSWLYDNTLDELTDTICMAEEHFEDKIEPNLKKLKAPWPKSIQIVKSINLHQLVAAMKPPVPTAIDKKQNSKKCQFQDSGNCRKAYLRLNRTLRNVLLSNKKNNIFLRKLNSSHKAVVKKLTKAQKEVADLRRRLEKCESKNQSGTGEQTEENHLRTTNVKKALRSSKRLRGDNSD